MGIYKVTTEIEADNIGDAWRISAKGHPENFASSSDWSHLESFEIEEINREFAYIKVKTEENN